MHRAWGTGHGAWGKTVTQLPAPCSLPPAPGPLLPATSNRQQITNY